LRSRLQQEISSRQKEVAKLEKQKKVLDRALKSDDLLIIADETELQVLPFPRADISKASEIIFILRAVHGMPEKSLEDIEKELLKRDADLRSELRKDLSAVEQWIYRLNIEIGDRQRRLRELPSWAGSPDAASQHHQLFTKLDVNFPSRHCPGMTKKIGGRCQREQKSLRPTV
jgi:hypothetical protein